MAILIYDCDECGVTYLREKVLSYKGIMATRDERIVELCEVCGRTLTYKGERIDTKTLCNVRTLP